MLPLSRRIAVSANVIFLPCTRLEIKFILSYLIFNKLFLTYVYLLRTKMITVKSLGCMSPDPPETFQNVERRKWLKGKN